MTARGIFAEGSKSRWRVAELLNRLPGQCWADLVGWVLGHNSAETKSPWSPIGWACRSDFAETGTCYCGKLRTPEASETVQGDES
jgi:hypothetical protein